MDEQKVVIKKSRKSLYGFILMTGGMILWYITGPYEKTRISYAESPKFTILIGIVICSLFLYFLYEIITRKTEIILSKEGIELRDKGFYEWAVLTRFLTREYGENSSRELILYSVHGEVIKFIVSDLDVNTEDLVQMILEYKGSSSLLFEGHT